MVTRGRKDLNHFSVMEDEEGTEHFENKQIAEKVARFYENLFKSTSTSSMRIVEEAIQPKITEAMNAKLTKTPDDKEIHEAVLDIHAIKPQVRMASLWVFIILSGRL